jgi:hypothetical protein
MISTNAARFAKLTTSWRRFRKSMLGASFARPGRWTIPVEPNSCFAPAPASRKRACPRRSWKGLDEMLTVTRLGLPAELRRSLA